MNIPFLAVDTQVCRECGAEPGESCSTDRDVSHRARNTIYNVHQARMQPIVQDVWMGSALTAEAWLDFPRREGMSI